MKKITLIAAVVAAMFLLNACVPTEQTEVAKAPEAEVTGTVEYDFAQLHNDVIAQFEGREMYGFVNSVDIDGSNSKKTVTVDVECEQQMDEDVLDVFAAAILRAVNDAASVQNKEIEYSSSIYFGSLWDEYGCTITFTLPAEEGAEPVVIKTVVINAGAEIPLDPDVETYEEEWLRELEILKRNEE